VNSNGTELKAEKLDKSLVKERMQSLRDANEKNPVSRWFYAPNAVNDIYGGDWDGYAITMFPDTTMIRTYSDGSSANTGFHSFALTIDPASYIYSSHPDSTWNEFTTYTLDSIQIPGYYTRNTAASIVDTLVIQISRDNWSYNLSANDYAWVYDNFGVQQMTVPAVLHDAATWYNSDPAEVFETIKVPMDAAFEADTTAMGSKYTTIGLANPLAFAEGDGFNISVTFVPGWTWTANVDTLNDYNMFSFWTYEQYTGAYPNYLDDRNVSHIMNIQHYREPTRDAYSPIYFYGETLSLEYHDVSVLLTATNVGIEETKALVNVNQNRPNPFSGSTTIDYSLNKAENVVLDIYNVAGAKVMQINEGAKTTGQHTITLDGSQLDAGVYYYTLTAGDNQVTKKMIVY
jgi:hypothetical protein